MKCSFYSLIKNTPKGFENRKPEKQELLADKVVILADSIQQAQKLIQDLIDRVYGIVITIENTFSHSRLGPFLYHVTVTKAMVASLPEIALSLLDIMDPGLVLVDENKILREELKRKNRELKDIRINYNTTLKVLKKSIQDLHERENLFRLSFNVSGIGKVITDLNGCFLQVNNFFSQMFGYTENEMLRLKVLDITHSDDIEESYKAIKKLIQGKSKNDTFSIDKRYMHKNGNIIWAQITVSLLRDEENKPLYMLGELVNITERKRAEEQLRQSEEEFRSLVETSKDLVFRLNNKSIIEYVSPQVRLYGYNPDDLMGTNVITIIPEDEKNRSLQIFKKVLKGELLENVVINLKNNNGEIIPMEINALPITMNGETTAIQGIMRDISERKKAQQRIEHLNSLLKAISNINQLIVQEENIEKLIKKASAYLIDTLSYLGCCIGLLDEESKKIVPKAQVGVCTFKKDWMISAEGQGQAPKCVKEAVKSRITYIVNNTSDCGHCVYGCDLSHRVVVVPMIERSQVIGILYVAFEKDIKVDTEEKELLEEVASDLIFVRDKLNAEEKLRESEENFRHLYENMTLGIYRTKPNGEITMANPALVKMLGYNSFQELSKRNLNEKGFASIDDREKFIKFISQKGQIRGFESSWKRKDGSVIQIRESAKIFEDKTGNVHYYEGTVEDITELKKAEKMGEERRTYLESILNAAPDAIVTLDKNHKIKDWNAAAEKMFGFTFSEVIGKNIDDFITNPDYYDEAKKITAKMLKGEYSPPQETIRFHKNGSPVHVIVSGSPILVEGNLLGVIGIYTNISDLVKTKKEKEKMQSQLIQAQKIEAIGILAGGIAHDFNNMLTAIQGSAEIIMSQIPDDDPAQRELKMILSVSKRAAGLTRQLLLFSRKQPMEYTHLNLNICIENLERMLYRLIGEDIEIITNLDDNLWTIQADQSTIEQVIMNIAINAKDAMPRGGKLVVTTQNIQIDEEYCKGISDAYPGNFVCLAMEDTGIGIDSETVIHIFEPFFSTKGPGEGTGLGLSVAYGIIREHNGWISVYSEPGKGTTFKIYLPALHIEPQEHIKKIMSIDEVKGNGENILVVEDDENVRQFTKKALEKNNYNVIIAVDAQQALEIFKKEKDNLDLIFCDVVLPDKTGIELVEELLQNYPDLKIILTSGYTDHRSQWPLIKEKEYTFLQKPYSLNNLLRKIKEKLFS